MSKKINCVVVLFLGGFSSFVVHSDVSSVFLPLLLIHVFEKEKKKKNLASTCKTLVHTSLYSFILVC